MRLHHLQLSNYRNIPGAEIELPAGAAIFVGDNAAGKSNLLEAVYLLATMRALRAETDAQLIRKEALVDVMPAARVAGQAETAGGPVKVEVTVMARPGANGPVATKTVRVNGVAKRLADAMGRLTAVLFTADDLEMLAGSPSLRRRYMDLTLLQIDAQYAGARQRFERVLVQRNSLLKGIREGAASRDELGFWDSELSKEGALLFQRRAGAVSEIAVLSAESHAALAPGEVLDLRYQPRLEGAPADLKSLEAEEVQEIYNRALGRGLSRDIATGMTLQGPHRDDLLFRLDGLPASGYASRAQQRTIALSLRMAEARFLLQRRGEAPVLLLDDILSEMDAGRRRSVVSSLSGMEQMLITGTDWDRFPPEFLSGAALFEVKAGAASALAAAAPRISQP